MCLKYHYNSTWFIICNLSRKQAKKLKIKKDAEYSHLIDYFSEIQ